MLSVAQQASRPIIIVERNKIAREKLTRGIAKSGIDVRKTIRFHNIQKALTDLKLLAQSTMDVDLVVTDTYYNDEINIFGLIRTMEQIPRLWNTPLVLYTNDTTRETINKVRLEIIHLPFRIISKSSSVDAIAKIVKEMLS